MEKDMNLLNFIKSFFMLKYVQKNIFYLFLIIELIFAFPTFANLKDLINEEYEKAEIINASKIPDAYRLITHALPLNVFPILPTSYRWKKEENEYVVMKHKAAPYHRLEFVVFSNDLQFPSTVNYLTLIDDVNVQSFAQTRPKGHTFGGTRTPYPFTVTEPLLPLGVPLYNLRNHVYLRPYVDGHCIDHADTIWPEYINYSHSSNDPRNHIPEPYNSYWGLHIRNPLVASIRNQGGCYMQLPYYSLNPLKTNLGPFVPEGIYFTEFSRFNERGLLSMPPQKTYHIPWNDNIHAPNQTLPWNVLLEHKRVNELNYGYLPYFSHLTGSDHLWWQKRFETLVHTSPIVNGNCQTYDARFTENLKMMADWELEAISFKLRYLYYAHATNHILPDDAHYWHGRALHHADQLFEFKKTPFSPIQLAEAKIVMGFANENQQDYWRQIITMQEELSQKPIQAVSPERKRYNLRSAGQIEENETFLDLQNQRTYHIVEFHEGRGSITQIKNHPPLSHQDIIRTRKFWLKGADLKKVKAWISVNVHTFNALDKSQIEIYYKPSTRGKASWLSIENALRSAGFTSIFRKFE